MSSEGPAQAGEEVHPVGEILAQRLAAQGWTQSDFADVLGRPAQFISEIVAGKKEITRESAAQIAAAFGDEDPRYWLKIQDSYHFWRSKHDSRIRAELDEVRLRARLKNLAPIGLLVERGFITSDNVHEQAKQLMHLYGMQDINDDPDVVLAARRTDVAEPLSAIQRAWVACVRERARGIPSSPYSPQGLLGLATSLSRVVKTSGFVDLPARFAAVGVRLVFVENFPTSKFDGCSLMFGDIPVIGLSGRGHRLDKVLFTLLHEIAHVLLGHLKSEDFILDEVGSGGRGAAEAAADDQAGTWIVGQPLPPSPDRVNAPWVRQVARERGIDEIVVVGRLQNLGLLSWRTALVKGAPTVIDQLRRW